MKKIVGVSFLLILLVGITVTSILASSPAAQTQCNTLVPAADNEVSASEFHATIQPTGVTVEGQTSGSLNAQLSRFEWSINLSNCSFRTTRLPGLNSNPSGGSIINQEFNQDRSNGEIDEEGTASPNANFQVGFTLITKDPPGFWLATTKNHLWWKNKANGKVRWQRMSKGCTAFTTPHL